MKPLKLIIICSISLSLLAFFASCSKSSGVSETGNLGVARVEFSINRSEYESLVDLNRAATPYLVQGAVDNVSRSTLEIGNDMLLVAELSPEEPTNYTERTDAAQSRDGRIAALETEDLAPGVHYRVLVYTSNGAFLRQQEYIRGSEGTAPPMELDGGSSYIFIVYSINTAAQLPAPTFVGGIQTLQNSRLNVVGNQDFMYFRREMTLVGGPEPNRLDIVLKHRFSQITTIIDATQTGYGVTGVTASFGPHSAPATINLDTGEITRGTQTARSTVTRTFPAGTAIASYPTIINASENNITNYIIASLTIGPLTMNNLTPFINLNVTPGVKYNLTLRITPTDELITHGSLPAARINGRIWMRHNLGANTNLNPDVNPSNNDLIGNFYQWGRPAIVANAATNAGAIPGWSDARGLGTGRWNSGTAANPIKTNFDPCPASFRVPNATEQLALIAATTQSNIGAFNNEYPITSAKVFRSRRNFNVQLTFPASGNRSFNNGAATSRGMAGHYWSATNIAQRCNHFALNVTSATVSDSVESWGMNIRCIAE